MYPHSNGLRFESKRLIVNLSIVLSWNPEINFVLKIFLSILPSTTVMSSHTSSMSPLSENSLRQWPAVSTCLFVISEPPQVLVLLVSRDLRSRRAVQGNSPVSASSPPTEVSWLWTNISQSPRLYGILPEQNSFSVHRNILHTSCPRPWNKLFWIFL